MKESKGIPASLGADCGIAIGFDLAEMWAASASRRAPRAATARERFIEGNILTFDECCHHSGRLRVVYGHRRQRNPGQDVMRQLKGMASGNFLVSSLRSASMRGKLVGVHAQKAGVETNLFFCRRTIACIHATLSLVCGSISGTLRPKENGLPLHFPNINDNFICRTQNHSPFFLACSIAPLPSRYRRGWSKFWCLPR
jgi:hypothetical protein